LPQTFITVLVFAFDTTAFPIAAVTFGLTEFHAGAPINKKVICTKIACYLLA